MNRIFFIISFLLGAMHFTFAQNGGTIIQNLDMPNDMVLVGDDMSYIERNTITKVDVSRLPFEPQIIVTGIGRGAGLVAQGDFLYATDFDAGAILKVSLSSNNFTTEVLIDGLRTPDMMAIDGDILYYTDPNAEIIGRVSLTNNIPQMSPLIRNAGRTIGIAIYENELFYTDQIENSVNKVILDVPFPRSEIIFSGLVRPQGLSKCGSEIYVSDDLGFNIWKFNPSCGPDELENVLSGVDTPRQTAVGNTFLYSMAISGKTIARSRFENNTCFVDKRILCESDTLTWLDGNMYTMANNTASITLQNSDGCDSVVVLNLTINETNTGITSSNGTFMAVETEGTYQWLNCRDGFGAIFQETMSTYTPGQPGFFALEVTKNGCVDTSECLRASIPTSVNDILIDAPFDLYPNPTSDLLNVDFKDFSTGAIEVYTLSGQLINSYNISHEKSFEFPISAPSGVYLIRVQLGESTWTERVSKI